MYKSDRLLLNISLITFLTLVIMNSVKFIGGISSIGSVGKFGFCIIFILFFLVAINRSKIQVKFLNKIGFILIFLCFFIFTLIFINLTQTQTNLLPNIAFPIYFIFYYLIIKLFIRLNLNTGINTSLSEIKLNIFYILRQTLAINFFVWFTLAIAFNVNMYEIDGAFGGFLQDEIHFGLYLVSGFLVSFYMRFNEFHKDKSKFNLLMLCIYAAFILYTSRNAILMVVVTLIYFFIISRIKNWVISALLLVPILLSGINILIYGLSFTQLNEITSGRFQIWTYVIEEISERNSWIIGSGLFNLNDIILKQSVGKNSLYLDSLTSLSLHSSYIELLAAGGIIAIIIFFGIIIKLWKKFGRIERSIILGIMVGALFESYLVQPFKLISFIFYIIILSHSIKIKVSHKYDRTKVIQV